MKLGDIEKELDDLEREQGDAKAAPAKAIEGSDDDDFDIIETDEDGKSTQDERLSADQRDDDEREAIRDSRRKERRDKRDRQKAARDASKIAIDRLSTQLAEATRRLAAVEGSALQRQAQELDQRIAHATRMYNEAEGVARQAAQQNNVAAYDQAQRRMTEAQGAYQQARQVRERISAQPQQAAEPEPDARTVSYAQEFLERHSWVDLDSDDEASAITRSIDLALVKSGSDPSSEDHWIELERRLRKRVPEKFETAEKGRPSRDSGPPMGSGREHASQSTKRQIFVNPERKAAMIAAGAWDDPVKRKAMLKRYADYDKNPAR